MNVVCVRVPEAVREAVIECFPSLEFVGEFQ